MSLEKTEINGIYRESSGALINNDTDALIAYKKKKQAQKELEKFMQTVKENQDKIVHLETKYNCINKSTNDSLDSQRKEIEEMKSDLIEIKQLLLKITNK
jgi:flagellar motility protein MotE (MotC chaperone)